MAKLKDKIESTFDEALILITAAEVVVGFQFKSVFETGFASWQAPRVRSASCRSAR